MKYKLARPRKERCKVCEGYGEVDGRIIYRASLHGPDERGTVRCVACGGSGEVVAHDVLLEVRRRGRVAA